ncbi:hypothetical protein DFJ58DRAFT_669649, partial [Suillus subalutaceus]|uniref:uncharacterized protein n=1 Tax=Suillus subalutaceus TaxID=48586 RepID=UPI001B882C08
ILCDKPVTYKIGGFRSHSHTTLCTACWITQVDKAWLADLLMMVSFEVFTSSSYACIN